MEVLADQLQVADQVVGFGVVSSVKPFHSAYCQYHNRCVASCRSRMIVQFNDAADEFVLDAVTGLEVHRGAEPAFRPDLLAELADQRKRQREFEASEAAEVDSGW